MMYLRSIITLSMIRMRSSIDLFSKNPIRIEEERSGISATLIVSSIICILLSYNSCAIVNIVQLSLVIVINKSSSNFFLPFCRILRNLFFV
uniref:Major sperm protein n=1 Tax=Parascaris univalens TaxID=6257 RepID=A0A915AD42_PARUN